MADREIKQKVTCANCINLVDTRHCQKQMDADARQFGRVWAECGSKPPTDDETIKRFCQHYEAMP